MRLLKFIAETINDLLKLKATEYIEAELEELEHIFALIALGFLVGYPVVPPSLSLKLMPYMEKELLIMIDRAERLDDQLGIVGFDIE
ncbi:hypothetical protein [Ignicoccus hospitalis]|uniref:Uncharacterized protein n=1 Tax=Ignicoccus hospitalis (strain KIN4/I / DSM 18386 / JCM 14125) TaxID=453591 RepID=A8AC49_IGNH4|nr:hypothetical protein [Ignicoccus hospitalis]ABU82501.1 hypothetical protein Igni_1325 [Ignicoccus hospitalis KIN4/I]HIH90598.1 hypothetical protein [Desulfurococcaceae archaeon]